MLHILPEFGEERGKLLLECALKFRPPTEYFFTAKGEGEVCLGKREQERIEILLHERHALWIQRCKARERKKVPGESLPQSNW
jgi:hypothetical protein